MRIGTSPPEAPPRVLLLDVMDTLVLDPFHQEMPGFFGLDVPGYLAVKHPHNWLAFERGQLSEARFLAEMFADGRRFDHAAFLRCVQHAYRWLPGIEALLQELKDQGVPMVALSNYPVWWRLIEQKLQPSRYLRWDFVSCKTGHRKPEPRAYLHAAESLGVAPEACLFVDDREGNCAGARAVGMPSLRFTHAAALREQLLANGTLQRSSRP